MLHSLDPGSATDCDSMIWETDVPANSQILPPALPLKSPNSRRPPQSNCPPGNVPLPDYGQRLEPKSRKGGISLTTPPRLAPWLQSLPPMLHMRNPSPMPRCSKAPRGLFVQVCVTRVFTGISVSPGPSLRQRLSRYTFRAGRNFTFVPLFPAAQTMHSSAVVSAEPACCDRHRLTFEGPTTTARMDLHREQSLRGHKDFPRHYPSASA